MRGKWSKSMFSLSFSRYEFSNKGADLFLESLARLNHYLKVQYSVCMPLLFTLSPSLFLSLPSRYAIVISL